MLGKADNFKKNATTGVVINTNKANYMARKNKKFAEKQMANEMASMRSELDQMKAIVQQIIEAQN